MNSLSFIRRHKKFELTLSLIALVVATVGLIALSAFLGGTAIEFFAVFGGYYYPFIAWVIYIALLQRGLKRHIIACDGKACVKCTYELTHSPPAGICPECGQQYEIEQNINLWLSRFTWPYEHEPQNDPGEQNQR